MFARSNLAEALVGVGDERARARDGRPDAFRRAGDDAPRRPESLSRDCRRGLCTQWAHRRRRAVRRDRARDLRRLSRADSTKSTAAGPTRSSPMRRDRPTRRSRRSRQRPRRRNAAITSRSSARPGIGSRSARPSAGTSRPPTPACANCCARRRSACHIARAPSTTCCASSTSFRMRRDERDRALAQRIETERTNRELERLNSDLQHKMIQIEALQAQLEVEAVHDPLTQLFNRRYLDSVAPGLIGPRCAAAPRWRSRWSIWTISSRSTTVTATRPVISSCARSAACCRCRCVRPTSCAATAARSSASCCRTRTAPAPRRRWRASLHAFGTCACSGTRRSLGGFTFSAGIAVLGQDGTTLSQLLEAADRTLYRPRTPVATAS